MPPHIRKLRHGAHELIVNGQPFLCRAGELNNSSFSDPLYMCATWNALAEHDVNVVLAAVGWEDIEPKEGEFDFATLDENIIAARSRDMKLVLLWFGSHKNGHMNYAPAWVKTNHKRFPRCQIRDPLTNTLVIKDYLSVFSNATVQADARAFEQLLLHLGSFDSQDETVIMVQVENEVGVLSDTRDRSPAAETAFMAPVPADLLDSLERSTSTLNSLFLANFPSIRTGLPRNLPWTSTFGSGHLTDEIFMAYHYAKFLNEVAARGRAQYPVPLFTNAALRATRHTFMDGGTGGGALPGIYPCGGPVDTVIDIWQLVAPNIDFVSPDIYFADYEAMCLAYTHRGQPLVIPEQRRDEYGAIRIWLAYGSYGALLTAPFGIDSIPPEKTAFRRHYELLKKTSSIILQARRSECETVGFFFDRTPEQGPDDGAVAKHVVLGDYRLTIERQPVFGRPARGYGMVIRRSKNAFLLIGEGYQITFASLKEGAAFTGILYMNELDIATDGTERRGRRLNGDETHCGKQAVMPSERPDDGWYPIPINVPSRTRIAECVVYSF